MVYKIVVCIQVATYRNLFLSLKLIFLKLEMYKWLLDQQITKLYSVHKQVPKQIKGTPKLENEFHRKQQYQAWSKIIYLS